MNYNHKRTYINKPFIKVLFICVGSIMNLTACENNAGATNQLQNSAPLKIDKSKLKPPFNFSQLAAGSYSVCAVESGEAYCWGQNVYGQLGNGTYNDSYVPVALAIGSSSAIPESSTILQIAAGYYSGCAIANDNLAYCWGQNVYGQLGNGTTNDSNLPVAVAIGGRSAIPSGATITQLSVGTPNACVITSDNLAYCWGYNVYGELGDGTTNDSNLPVAVAIGGRSAIPESSTIMQIASGFCSTCAIASDNLAYCWGYNMSGKLGNGTTNDSDFPVAVAIGGSSAIPESSTILQISGGTYNSCAIANDNLAYCWGFNGDGELGNGTTNDSSVPVAVAIGGSSAIPESSTILQIAAGAQSTCVLANNNQVYCWGYNGYGELGDSTYNTSNSPVAVATGGSSAIPSGATIVSITSGYHYACATDNNNNTYCWGSNNYGQLGNGTNINSNIPVLAQAHKTAQR